MITSKTNPQIKKIRQIMDFAKARRESGLFAVEGIRLVREVPPELLETVYISSAAAKDHKTDDFPCRSEVVSEEIFSCISDTVSPQGILALVRKPELEFPEEGILFLLLDDVRDPGNLGTMIRTAEAAGASVIMSPGCADVFNPKVVRSTMGSIFRVPLAVMDLKEAVHKLRKNDVTVYAAALKDSVSLEEIVLEEKRAFIIGNEANGISEGILEEADKKIRIPMKGKVESLNAAVSAAILLFR